MVVEELRVWFYFNLAPCSWLRRHYLLRDVYDDMMLDGVKPIRDTFHSLIVGTMKGSRLQDSFYFRDEMKAMGLVLDVRTIVLIRGLHLEMFRL